MSPTAATSPRFWSGLILVGALLGLAFLRLPGPASLDVTAAGWMAADHAVHHGARWGSEVLTPLGPLGALLTPFHSGGALRLNLAAQAVTALMWAALALVFAEGFARTPRIWFLAVFFLLSNLEPRLLHPLLLLAALATLGRDSGTRWARGTAAAAVGMLLLIDIRYWVIALAAALIGFAKPTHRRDRWFVGGITAGVLLAGWFMLGQTPVNLFAWLFSAGSALPRLAFAGNAWSTFSLALAGVAWLALLMRLDSRSTVSRLPLLLLFWIVWRGATGDLNAAPAGFFALALFTGVLGFSDAKPARGRLLLLLAGAAGLAAVQPRLLTEPLLQLNDRLAAHVAMLRDPRGAIAAIRADTAVNQKLAALPGLQAIVGHAPVDFLGNTLAPALVNGFAYQPRPAALSLAAESDRAAERNAAFYRSPGAPAFVIQRPQAWAGGLAPAEDSPAKRELDARYDFVQEENGFALWRQRADAPAASPLAAATWSAEGTAAETLALPAPAGPVWLSISFRRSVLGWLHDQLLPPLEPTLVLRDSEGTELAFRADRTALARGFLLEPFLPTGVALVRHQAGDKLPPIRSLTLEPAPGHAGQLATHYRVELRPAAAPAVSGWKAGAENLAMWRRISNRLPSAIAAAFPPHFDQLENTTMVFAHPDSAIEFTVRPGDRQLTGNLGILGAAYENGNHTDGVEFRIDYEPLNGPPQTLLQRELDPLARPADRGLQPFTVILPGTPASGRLVLRTQNVPGKNAAWDWSYWTALQFE